ncbi:hypothetical protein D3C85_1944760 [compost metagenome]
METLSVLFEVFVIASVLIEKPSKPKGAAAHVTAATPQNLRLLREVCLMFFGMQIPTTQRHAEPAFD